MDGVESKLERRLDAYQIEARAIKRKLKNGVLERKKRELKDGVLERKKERRESRLKDIEFRLIPDLVCKIL